MKVSFGVNMSRSLIYYHSDELILKAFNLLDEESSLVSVIRTECTQARLGVCSDVT